MLSVLILGSIYKAVIDRDTPQERIATSERSFCAKCATMLWLYDETWSGCFPFELLVMI